MGRELRRKQAKKEGKSLKNENITEDYNLTKFVKVSVIVILSAVFLYLVSAIFITKEINLFGKNNTTNTTNQTVSNAILAKSIFNQSEESYYVYFYDFNESNNNINTIVSSKLSGSKVYRVDTSSSFNSKYVSDTSNKSATTLDDLKVVKDTLIKIEGDNITMYLEGEKEITNNLNK